MLFLATFSIVNFNYLVIFLYVEISLHNQIITGMGFTWLKKKNDTFDLADDDLIMSQHCCFQMGASLTPALLEPSAPVSLMVPGSVESAQLATLAMVSSVEMWMR